jgi:hypothetical protein
VDATPEGKKTLKEFADRRQKMYGVQNYLAIKAAGKVSISHLTLLSGLIFGEWQ